MPKNQNQKDMIDVIIVIATDTLNGTARTNQKYSKKKSKIFHVQIVDDQDILHMSALLIILRKKDF